MWPRSLNSYLSVLELREFARNQRSSRPQSQVRSAAKIAIIDDEKFQPFANLSSYGYKFFELPDIKSISEIQDYDIILCDLMGVGKHFDTSIGGASIIREIKKNYPTKFVIAYSGARSNTTEANIAKEFADDYIRKDAEISRWVEHLDDILNLVTDPYEIWLLARQGLLDNETDIRTVVKLEDAYVRTVKNKDQQFSLVRKSLDKLDLPGGARSIIYGLISSAIYALVLS